MCYLFRIVWQTLLIVIVGSMLGLIVNAVSNDPLDWVYKPKTAGSDWPILDAETVMQHINEGTAIIVDARDPNEYAEGHLPSAVNIPASDFKSYFNEFGMAMPRDFPIVIYCQGGDCDQSLEVIHKLNLLEFEALSLYEGGWLEWKEKGLPVEE